ncbi:MAG: sigma 54-interacting transcriptional regulator, partial [Planctomycetota bacterium]
HQDTSDLLSHIATDLEAVSATIVSESRTETSSRRRVRCMRTLSAPLRRDGQIHGILRVAFESPKDPDGRTVAAVHAFARALALRMTSAPSRIDTESEAEKNTETRSLERTHALPSPEREEGIIAESDSMRRLLRTLDDLSSADLPVLICGESGTGKDLLARRLHDRSRRASSPFRSIHCSAIPAELFESDLIGYRKGAFSGADASRSGFLFQAEGGSFLLEEVGELDERAQGRLLRLIEERSVRPLGATEERSFDVRFLASTQRDLDRMVEIGEFRRDLYYRLQGTRVVVPPLRERRDDIPPLLDYYARRSGNRSFTKKSTARLSEYDWPGNVRELIGLVERLSLESHDNPVDLDEVEALLREVGKQADVFSPSLFERHSLETLKTEFDKAHLKHLHARFDGDVERMAEALGTSTRSIYRRFEKLGLKPGDLKS